MDGSGLPSPSYSLWTTWYSGSGLLLLIVGLGRGVPHLIIGRVAVYHGTQ